MNKKLIFGDYPFSDKNKSDENNKIIISNGINHKDNNKDNNDINISSKKIEEQKEIKNNEYISELDEPVKPLNNEETEKLLNDPKFEKVKILKNETEKEVHKTVNYNSENKAIFLKQLVSKNKTRFCYDGFDLDLTYITPRIIAMGYPSTNLESLYRNKLEDVQNFFFQRHPGHYKIYNLCKERKYENYFPNEGYYPFNDHEAPPLNLIKPFCEDVKHYLDENEENVVGIHCLAGKGRTGTFICCLLLYLNTFNTAEESLLYYGLLRVGSPKGITVPSQQRYVYYFEYILKNNIPHPIIFKKIIIRKITLFTVPKVGKKFQPNFKIENQEKIFKYSDIVKGKHSYSLDLEFIDLSLGLGISVCGDVRIQFYQIQFLKSEKLFKFWFNTNFLPQNGIYEIKKEAIDNACKDKNCKIYKKDFKIQIEFLYL